MTGLPLFNAPIGRSFEVWHTFFKLSSPPCFTPLVVILSLSFSLPLSLSFAYTFSLLLLFSRSLALSSSLLMSLLHATISVSISYFLFLSLSLARGPSHKLSFKAPFRKLRPRVPVFLAPGI